MDLKLNVVDILQVGVTSPRTLKLIPTSSGRGTQKIAVGDHDGILQCFTAKRDALQYTFKTLPGTKISALTLGGSDKIFIASGNEVRGFTKKGKQFLGFDTNLTETIRSIYVKDSDLMVCGNYVYSHFVDCRDTNYYLSADKINDIACLPSEKIGFHVPVLACEDRVLRILKDSQLSYETAIPGSGTVVSLLNGNGGDNGDEVLYGTSNGNIGLIDVSPISGNQKWTSKPSKGYGGIVCFDFYDIMEDGVRDLIVGRDDGQIEVFSLHEGLSPTLRYSHTLTESVTSVQGGSISSSSQKELVTATYSGWVATLTTEPIDKFQGVQSSAFQLSRDAKQKLQLLKSELEELQQKANSEKEKLIQTVHETGGYSTTAPIEINDKFYLCPEDSSYYLSVETLTAIDHVLLQSNVPIDLLDIEKNSAVVSFSKCPPESGNYMLATYRCQSNTTRLEVKLRTIEGQFGTLKVYITPRLNPRCSHLKQYLIKPLSLHQRSHTNEESGPLNSLTLRGPFSLSEIHNWILFCLPELPDKPSSTTSMTFTYISTFLHTKLHCFYRKGEAVFRSENLSTISILKDVLTKEATKKKMRLDISCGK
ncbi:Bardet-Biedl syndrome 7 protein, variant 2 [Chamberlinius hualienensis]